VPALDEKVLYEPVTNYFLNRGYFVVSGSPKPDIAGTSEFGLNVEGRPLRVDIVAARWDDSHQIETVAVECKMLGSTARSVGAGLSQATDYQVAFDRVFIATETIGTLGSKKSVLDALGIGHLQVDSRNKVRVIIEGDFRNKERFDNNIRADQVTPRLIMFLAFTEALSKPIRYGETFGGGGYIAKDMGYNIQLNCWIDSRTKRLFFGINVEHIDSFRHILRTLDWSEFGSKCRHLKRHRLSLRKDPIPGRPSAESVQIVAPTVCPSVDVAALREAISSVVQDKSKPRRWRPHLQVFAPILEYRQTLRREECIGEMQEALGQVKELLAVLVGPGATL